MPPPDQASATLSPRSVAGMTFFLAWMAVVLLVAGVARIGQLGSVNYWFDESFSIRMSEFSWGEIVVRSAEDNHPPFSFFAQKGWDAVFGTNELATRSLSVVWSLGIVIAAAGLAWEVVRGAEATKNGRARFAAILAGLLVGLSPIHLHWAQQTRMYAPACFFAVLSTWLLVRAIGRVAGFAGWSAYVLAAICGLYTHTFVALVVAGHGFALGLCSLLQFFGRLGARPALMRGWVAVLFSAAAWGPWMVAVIDQTQRVQKEFWSPPFASRMIGEGIGHAFLVIERPPPEQLVGLVVAQLLVVVAAGLVATRRVESVVLAATFAIPIAAVVAMSVWGRT